MEFKLAFKLFQKMRRTSEERDDSLQKEYTNVLFKQKLLEKNRIPSSAFEPEFGDIYSFKWSLSNLPMVLTKTNDDVIQTTIAKITPYTALSVRSVYEEIGFFLCLLEQKYFLTNAFLVYG